MSILVTGAAGFIGFHLCKKLIERKKALYNYAADQRENKWKNNPDLVKIELDNLPSYISRNKKKFESWID